MDGHGGSASLAVLLARSMLSAPSTLPGPHDLFARYTFGHPERAAAEREEALRAPRPAPGPAGLALPAPWAQRGTGPEAAGLEAARQRILSCTDGTTLDRWFDQALNATLLSDVLDDLAQ